MNEILENIEYQKLLFLSTVYGKDMRSSLCEVITNLLYLNDSINEYGDNSVLPLILKSSEEIETSIKEMERIKKMLTDSINKLDSINSLYNHLVLHTITDVKTGKEYNYVAYKE